MILRILLLSVFVLFGYLSGYTQENLLIPQSKIDSIELLLGNQQEDEAQIVLLNEYARLNFYNQEYLLGFNAIIKARELSRKMDFPEAEVLYHHSLAAFLGQHHIYEYHMDKAANLIRQLEKSDDFDQLYFPEGYPMVQDSSLIDQLVPLYDHFEQLEEKEIQASILDALIWAHFREGNYEQCYQGNLIFIKIYKEIGELYPVFVHYTYLSYIAEYTDLVDMDWLKTEFASFFTNFNDFETIGPLYMHIGNFFRNSNQPRKAIDFYLRGSEYYESINDLDMLARILNGLGELYQQLGLYPLQDDVLEKRISILQELNRIEQVQEAKRKAVWTKLDANRYEDARLLINELMADSNQANQDVLIGNKNDLEGQILMKESDFYNAIPYLQKALEIYEKTEHEWLIARIHLHLSNCHLKLGNLDLALDHGLVSFNNQNNGSGGDQYAKEINLLLSEIYEALDDQPRAYRYLRAHQELISESTDESSAVFETLITSAIEKSQKEIERLERERLQEAAQNKIQRLWLLSISGALISAVILVLVLYRNIKNKQKAKQKIEEAYSQLKATQSQLIQSEKMASLGELTAGIAHEIQNPLNFVNNFSEVSDELIVELKAERSKVKAERDEKLEDEILNDVGQNLQKIKHHGQRASEIVKSMLQHSRTGTGEKEPTDINALADEYLRLAYHGMRAKDKSFNAEFKTEFDPNLPKANVVPQDIGRVLLNLINNAFQAVAEVENPEVVLSTKFSPYGEGQGEDKIEISVKDNGPGIPDDIKEKIFQPFFTTKPTGEGTGLGLSLSYDIVKAHGGEIKVESNKSNGTTFILNLPVT